MRSLSLPLANSSCSNIGTPLNLSVECMSPSDFIVAEHLAAGTLEALLEKFAPPPLGIYAVLASNRYVPHRVRVLIEFLASRLAEVRSDPA
ncbi:hypothetical protein D3C78_630830 [compost metagenome]